MPPIQFNKNIVFCNLPRSPVLGPILSLGVVGCLGGGVVTTGGGDAGDGGAGDTGEIGWNSALEFTKIIYLSFIFILNSVS